jgi:aryl-alcohol dehydrogenase-like predicted oxidoreductase
MTTMERRRLGRTGLDVSVLTFNARGLDPAACKDIDLAQAGAALALALDHGVNAIASPADAEARAAAADLLRRKGQGRAVHIFSHAPPLLPHNLPSPHLHADAVFPGAHIRAHAEAALKTFGVERLAILFLPAWQPEWTKEGDWLRTLQALKKEGKIAGFGIAPFDHDPGAASDAAQSGQIDCVEVMYNPFDPEAAVDLFPLCQEKGVGVVARSPLYGGALAAGWGEVAFAPADWREAFFYPEHRAETRERVAGLASEVSPPDDTVADLALRFSLSHPAVSTVSIGMRTPAHVEANVAAAARGALSQKVLDRLALYKWLC